MFLSRSVIDNLRSGSTREWALVGGSRYNLQKDELKNNLKKMHMPSKEFLRGRNRANFVTLASGYTEIIKLSLQPNNSCGEIYNQRASISLFLEQAPKYPE